MPDVPLHLFRKYVKAIIAQTKWDAAEIARRSGLPNTTVSRPLRDDYQGQGVRASTIAAIQKGTKVAPPPEVAELLGEGGPPVEISDLQLAIEIAERITAGRFPGLDSAVKAEIIKDVLDTLQQVGRRRADAD